MKTSRQTYCTEDACRQVARAAELELKRRYAKAKYDADPRAGRARVAAMRAAWTPARRAAARAYAEARKAPVTCDVCGTQWSARDKGRTYQGFRCCSTMCRTFVQYGVWPKCDLTAPPVTGTCVRCGVEYRQRNEGQQYCNKACRTARIFSAGPCAWCREPFISSIWERSTSAPKWCSAQCRRDHKLFRWKSSTGELAITYQERLAVYMRDDWICHICGDPVNRAARVPELDAPTIDHVVATARGGAHAMDNWRTAHFYCNCYKRDLPLDEIA